MSGYPSIEGVAKVLELLEKRAKAHQNLSACRIHASNIERYEQEVRNCQRDIVQQLEEMDCKSTGNTGWEERWMSLLQEITCQVRTDAHMKQQDNQRVAARVSGSKLNKDRELPKKFPLASIMRSGMEFVPPSGSMFAILVLDYDGESLRPRVVLNQIGQPFATTEEAATYSDACKQHDPECILHHDDHSKFIVPIHVGPPIFPLESEASARAHINMGNHGHIIWYIPGLPNCQCGVSNLAIRNNRFKCHNHSCGIDRHEIVMDRLKAKEVK
jgi:hypothetical protein